ncbi:MAG: UTP--glucose-1-phosphate uridylyltransferase, partial [Ornithinibacter sp.]
SRKDSTKVIQIESAMGAALEVFEGSQALLVPRTRFRPVKTTNELLLLRSDLFGLDAAYDIVSTGSGPDPLVDLDAHYTLIEDFDARFAHGAPSLAEATSLRVVGDVWFGADVVCVGDVTVGPEVERVPDGTVLEGGP